MPVSTPKMRWGKIRGEICRKSSFTSRPSLHSGVSDKSDLGKCVPPSVDLFILPTSFECNYNFFVVDDLRTTVIVVLNCGYRYFTWFLPVPVPEELWGFWRFSWVESAVEIEGFESEWEKYRDSPRMRIWKIALDDADEINLILTTHRVEDSLTAGYLEGPLVRDILI